MDELKKRFVQTKDEFDPSTTCGLCGAPLNEEGEYDGLDLYKARSVAREIFACWNFQYPNTAAGRQWISEHPWLNNREISE